MPELLAELDSIGREAAAELATAADPEAVERWRIRWLGSNGRLKSAMDGLKQAPRELKPALGKRLNELKSSLDAAFAEAKSTQGTATPAAGATIDVTEPGIPAGPGRRHVLTRTIDEITDVFGRMGFSIAEGPEVEDEFHNFIALNIPPGHPARDPKDNFYMAGGESGGADAVVESGASRPLLRSQTSTIQIRAMETMKPPLKVIAVGRVYRPDAHDATHFSMFHQVEGLCVDRGVTMVDLKTALFQFARAYFGPEAEVRMRPSFFPFTEPSAELDIKMRVKTGVGSELRWVELGGCGMVDPNVFRHVGIDSEEWTGYAFGLGIERIAMRRYGIADIRWLFENDARFLRQF